MYSTGIWSDPVPGIWIRHAAMERHHGESKPNGKTLRTRLQRQLEFYLSASNLRQDKFLQQSMDEQGFVPVALFLAFNK